jgi:CRISPR-associated protein Csm1
MDILAASSRVALAAFLHDLGKFSQRADVEVNKEALEIHKQEYCPVNFDTKRPTHIHAAYTALAFDTIERNAPDIVKGDMSPFASRIGGKDITDSLVNAAAMHHRPETFLQWIIATADRVSSGFERDEFENYNKAEDKTDTGKNYIQARQLTLFEQILRSGTDYKRGDLHYRYPLKAMSARAIFPAKRQDCEPDSDVVAKQEYKALWDQFLKALEQIPRSHRQSLPLWLDHFDTAWLTFTHAIPSATAFGVRPDVSLYDHSKAAAALAVALWRWHHAKGTDNNDAVLAMKDRSDWNDEKLLLIQGDFFGIQDFIFAEGAQTNKHAAKLLRGRSFHVSLLTELAALRVLEILELPPTSQIINAAGKFLIVAPNTDDTIYKLAQVRQEFDQWFLKNSFGVAGIGIVWQAASCNDFVLKNEKSEASGFSELMRKLFEQLEEAKLQRYQLCDADTPVLHTSFAQGVCQWQGRLPADKEDADGKKSSALARDQIKIGKLITSHDRLLILRDDPALRRSSTEQCELAVFGYQIMFTGHEEISGKFGELASKGSLLRCWDFSFASALDQTLWSGYARRNINGYVPRFIKQDSWSNENYTVADKEQEKGIKVGDIKPLDYIACDDRMYVYREVDKTWKWEGQVALMTLKGDVDDLGHIFQKGLEDPAANQKPSFAKMAALSRQMNAFFAVYLPTLCATEFPNVYTVFAGGDDFFLIGPWHSTQQLAARMASEFKRYVAENPAIHFSAGMVMTKPGHPIHGLAESAEDALAVAKQSGKNAVRLFNQTISWDQWHTVTSAQDRLDEIREEFKLSTGFVYGLLHLLNVSEQKSLESAMWRSKLHYRSARLIETQRQKFGTPALRQQAINKLVNEIGEQGIAKLKGSYRIPLFNHFYRQR